MSEEKKPKKQLLIGQNIDIRYECKSFGGTRSLRKGSILLTTTDDDIPKEKSRQRVDCFYKGFDLPIPDDLLRYNSVVLRSLKADPGVQKLRIYDSIRAGVLLTFPPLLLNKSTVVTPCERFWYTLGNSVILSELSKEPRYRMNVLLSLLDFLEPLRAVNFTVKDFSLKNFALPIDAKEKETPTPSRNTPAAWATKVIDFEVIPHDQRRDASRFGLFLYSLLFGKPRKEEKDINLDTKRESEWYAITEGHDGPWAAVMASPLLAEKRNTHSITTTDKEILESLVHFSRGGENGKSSDYLAEVRNIIRNDPTTNVSYTDPKKDLRPSSDFSFSSASSSALATCSEEDEGSRKERKVLDQLLLGKVGLLRDAANQLALSAEEGHLHGNVAFKSLREKQFLEKSKEAKIRSEDSMISGLPTLWKQRASEIRVRQQRMMEATKFTLNCVVGILFPELVEDGLGLGFNPSSEEVLEKERQLSSIQLAIFRREMMTKVAAYRGRNYVSFPVSYTTTGHPDIPGLDERHSSMGCPPLIVEEVTLVRHTLPLFYGVKEFASRWTAHQQQTTTVVPESLSSSSSSHVHSPRKELHQLSPLCEEKEQIHPLEMCLLELCLRVFEAAESEEEFSSSWLDMRFIHNELSKLHEAWL